jgi:DNA topoisomerase II
MKMEKDGKLVTTKYLFILISIIFKFRLQGLGTSSDREFKEYFSQLSRHTLNFVYEDKQDLDAIDMAFNAKRAEDRKQWIQNYQDGDFVDHSQATVSYKDFIYKELVQFSRYDVVRSIPSCIDGLKPVQRKVLFASFKRNLKSDIKIAQFVGCVFFFSDFFLF